MAKCSFVASLEWIAKSELWERGGVAFVSADSQLFFVGTLAIAYWRLTQSLLALYALMLQIATQLPLQMTGIAEIYNISHIARAY